MAINVRLIAIGDLDRRPIEFRATVGNDIFPLERAFPTAMPQADGGMPVVLPSADIVGFKVSTLPLEDNARLITDAALSGRGLWVMTLNLEMVARAATDPAYRTLAGDADVIVADGVPIVWLSRLAYGRVGIAGRTCGVDLTDYLLRQFPGRIGILGGAAPRRALERLGIDPARVVFLEDGPVKPDDLAVIVSAINDTRCALLFVALGVPKQDQVCRALRRACPGLVCIGVGGSFDTLAGLVPRAPRWLRNAGFEWLFRVIQEPLRLWRRYLLLYPRAVPAIVRWLVNDCRKSAPTP